MSPGWQQTACILCSQNCGVEVQLEEGHIVRVRGDRAHPMSGGYACEKAQRLDYYQHGRDRLTTPLRRRPDGTFEAIDWDTAIREVAGRLRAVRDTHGGESIFYDGGGGQGNHLGGAYARATRAALGSVFTSNALAQEKTGEFWVDGQLYGRARCHTSGDFEHAEVAVFVGKNPWQSHGFPRARATLRALANDPNRALIVIDPRRTETAALADFHLQVRPGTDAFCLSALLAVLVQEDLVDHAFLAARTSAATPQFDTLRGIPVADYCARAGLEEALVRAVARRIARAESVAMFEDLGIQQAPHSTLNSYLEKLVYLLTGNFGKRGGMNIHTGLIPANVIPEEILTDHPQRLRAMIVESANPAHSLADSQRMREALAALDVLVVIDVAMTETARLADYVLPGASQFEKWEATFFNLEFPKNVFHLRAPIFDPQPGTLAEPEIHRRLVRALGALAAADLTDLHAAAARIPSDGRGQFAEAFFRVTAEKPHLGPLTPVVLYETLGPTLPDGAGAAALLWGAAHICAMTYPDSVRRAGFDGEGRDLGEQLFEAILHGRSGVTFTVDEYDESWRRLATPDGRVRLEIPELLDELHRLADEDPAARPGVADGGRVRVTTRRASLETVVEVTDTLQAGHVSLPNGLGVSYPDASGRSVVHGIPTNELTASEDRDWLAGTPWHKHVLARVEALG